MTWALNARGLNNRAVYALKIFSVEIGAPLSLFCKIISYLYD